MSTLSEKSNVADWVTAKPACSLAFEKLGIDYWCGGGEPLGKVCTEKGLEVEGVLHELRCEDAGRSSAEQTNWTEKTPEDLIEHIELVHHQYLRNELPRLSTMVAKVLDIHGERHPELSEIKEVYDGMRTELEFHTKKEENELFPMIRQLWYVWAEAQSSGEGIQVPIHANEYEHVETGRLLDRLRQLSGNYTPPEDACPTYRALMDGLKQLELDLHHHIHEENNILFPGVFETGFATRTTK